MTNKKTVQAQVPQRSCLYTCFTDVIEVGVVKLTFRNNRVPATLSIQDELNTWSTFGLGKETEAKVQRVDDPGDGDWKGTLSSESPPDWWYPSLTMQHLEDASCVNEFNTNIWRFIKIKMQVCFNVYYFPNIKYTTFTFNFICYLYFSHFTFEHYPF